MGADLGENLTKHDILCNHIFWVIFLLQKAVLQSTVLLLRRIRWQGWVRRGVEAWVRKE